MSERLKGDDGADCSRVVALITGGGGLLGREHAYAILELGGDVVLTDVDGPAIESLYNELVHNFPRSKVFRFVMDVTSESEVGSVLGELQKLGISINVLINNAAIDFKVQADISERAHLTRVENFNLDQWALELNVGLTGAFICTKLFGSEMARLGGGVIINIASDLSVIAPDQRLYRNGVDDNSQPVKPVTYSVIKHGLIGLTRYTASYWADRNVRCNALSPGGIYHNQPKEFVDRLESRIPMGRMAQPDEYRGAIQFLASNKSSYMTGHNLVLDGGRSVI